MRINFHKIIIFFAIGVLFSLMLFIPSKKLNREFSSFSKDQVWSEKKSKIKGGQEAYMKPDGFIEYFNTTSKRLDKKSNSYKKGYRGKELQRANVFAKSSRKSSNPDAEFISRGPGNVGGRTRAIAIDPDDNTHCTWIAGAASGGIWKTTDCGLTWTNIGKGLPNLSTNSIAQSASNPDVLYVGTGEVFAGNSSFVRGDGIYKSTDRGQTWGLLNSTVDNTEYISVNRIAIDPSNSDNVVVATNTGIYITEDGGTSWIQTFDAPIGSSVQDLQVDPSDYKIQYAGVNSQGIYKSTDGGLTWNKSSTGISEGVRFEIAVAPSNTDVVYTSSFVGETTILYYSEDKGANWVRVEDENYNTNFLGGQGWYDNTIEVNPYNPYEVFVGGVSIGKFVVDPNDIGQTEPQFLGVDLENTDFLSFIDFGATYNSGSLNVSDGDISPSENPVTVEIRWGGSNIQKAHRFVVPENGGANGDGGAGVPTSEYQYQDYVDVPFEVWDIENNRQLMVSFRDQENNGVFNLNPRDDTNDPDLLKAREYFYIHDLTYDADSPNNDVTTTTGGIEFANMYYFWPILSDGSSWNPDAYVNSIMRIKYGAQVVAAASAQAVYDAYGNWQGENQSTLHPDHHNLTFVKTDEANEEFMVINGNDGAFGFSTDNGVTFEERESGYVTSQFYGADKKPGADRYIGGMQDNGTYVSTGGTVDSSNVYSFEIGGDGFEVLWHANNTDLVIGGSQFNGLARSTNGGQSFSSATSGVTDGPFITRLAGSRTNPDVIYAIGGAGVYKSTDFGSSWTMKEVTESTWGGTASASDVEVSLANDQIVWAGAGMAQGVLDIFVSTDGGETYNSVSLPSFDPQAYSTGIYTHPLEDSTAYVLFSIANQAKILKTENLGQTWEDISGFGAESSTSSGGFPDVYVHSLLVMPFDPNVIWVGTEIGIFETLDAGESWSIRNDFPSVSVWSMKVVDDQIVIGTHGRGIWTATIEQLAPSALTMDFIYDGYGKGTFETSLPVSYDGIEFFVNGASFLIVDQPNNGNQTFEFSGYDPFNNAYIEMIGDFFGVDYQTSLNIGPIDLSPEILNYNSDFDGTISNVTIELENNEPFEKVEVYFNNNLVHTDTQTLTESDDSRMISFDYEEQASNTVELRSYINDLTFSSTISQLVTSNQSAFERGVILYPNPVVSQLNIEDKTSNLRRVQIFTSNGKLVKSLKLNEASRLTTVNVGELEEGMYLVQLTDKNGAIKTKRIVKQ